jgi:hypothetical protein
MNEAETHLLRLFLLYGEGPIPAKILDNDGLLDCDSPTAQLLWNGMSARYLVRNHSTGDLHISINGMEILKGLGHDKD